MFYLTSRQRMYKVNIKLKNLFPIEMEPHRMGKVSQIVTPGGNPNLFFLFFFLRLKKRPTTAKCPRGQNED